MQRSYSFELFNFQDFFHDLFRFFKTLGLVVNLKTLLLIAAEIQFANPGEKDSYKHHKLTQQLSKETKATVFPVCNIWLNFHVQGQFEIKIFTVQHKNTTYFIWIKKNWTWA